MTLHTISQGLDIPIKGRATGQPVQLVPPDTVAYAPQELRGITPRLAVRAGDTVKRGSLLFYHKQNPEIKFLSPVSGKVREIRRGPRRVITDVIVERHGDDSESFKGWDLSSLQSIKREHAAGAIQTGGLWGFLRTRPLNLVADPAKPPQSILISAMDTGPLQPDADVLLDPGDGKALQAGIYALTALTDGDVFLAVRDGTQHPALDQLSGVSVHRFKGPHPAGDPTVQINYIDPPRGSGVVWYLRAWEAVQIGRLLLEGKFPAERVYAAVGAGVKEPGFVRTVLGAPLSHITGEVINEPARWLRGSVLTGEVTDAERWGGFYTYAVHVLPETVRRHLLGWFLPNLGTYSFHRAFLSGILGSSGEHDLRPGLYGGHRGMVPIGAYSRVIASPDIMPEFLFKSILAGDLEESIQLGLLDISEEEAALCSYV